MSVRSAIRVLAFLGLVGGVPGYALAQEQPAELRAVKAGVRAWFEAVAVAVALTVIVDDWPSTCIKARSRVFWPSAVKDWPPGPSSSAVSLSW